MNWPNMHGRFRRLFVFCGLVVKDAFHERSIGQPQKSLTATTFRLEFNDYLALKASGCRVIMVL